MTREDILKKAMEIVANGNRERQYGSPENSFTVIADLWNAYLRNKPEDDHAIYPHDVAAMMALLKIARISGGHYSEDSWIDLAGYAACGGEVQSHYEIADAE